MYTKSTILVPAMVLVFSFISGCDREKSRHASSEPEEIIIAVTPWPGSAALYVAQEKGYFKEEGIHPTFDPYISGHLGLDAVLTGKADFVTVGDTPIARAAVKGLPVAIVATICEINRAVLIIARKDRGISSPQDLRGKKVGVVKGTTADFFLHIFLATSYIKFTDVSIVDLAAGHVVDALVSGEVDAVCTWSPHTITARKKLGDDGVIFDDPTIYKMTWNLTTTKQYVQSHPERIRSVLRAIVRANGFIAAKQDQARAISGKMAGTDNPLFDQEWEDYTFTAALHQSLLLNLEDQARWMGKNGSGGPSEIPNFMNFIHSAGLRAVEPSAVGILSR